jgi:putative peptidoglycan lipid II flippase
LQSRTAPSLILVGGLLLAALIVVLVLWATIGPAGDGQGAPTTVPATTEPAAAGAPAPLVIAGITAYDPGGDGEENDDLVGAALSDDDPTTNWRTLCYSDRFMGKEGVGLAVSLSRPGTGTLSFDVGNAPYTVDVFATTARNLPASIADWGDQIGERAFSQQPGQVQVATPARARHLLILFREIGRDGGCSAANPYRGTLGNIRFP